MREIAQLAIVIAHHDSSSGDVTAHASGYTANLNLTDHVGLLAPVICVVLTIGIAAAVMSGKLPLSTLLFRSVAGQKRIDEVADQMVKESKVFPTDLDDRVEDDETRENESASQAPTWVGVIDLDIFKEED